jgi:hypothetical protein
MLREMLFGPRRVWMEFVLPIYALAMLLIYYQPQVLVPAMDDPLTQGKLWWALWILIGALGGLLALSGLFLAFSLLYSPVYLIGNATRILDPKVWVDRREMRFYVGCFALFCGLAALGFLYPPAALPSFTLLSGFAQTLWRVLA